MDRITIVKQIGATLAANCENCAHRHGDTERELRAKGLFAQADRFCLKVCPIGYELKALGTALDEHLKVQRALRPRKRLEICEEEVG